MAATTILPWITQQVKRREIATPFTRDKSFNVSSWRGGANYAVNDNYGHFRQCVHGFPRAHSRTAL